MPLESVIGLEVHVQLNTSSKIFCACSTAFGAPPNENTCPTCLGLPGALPVLNEKVLELAIRASLAVNCSISMDSIFARKNYFYPDLPKGYQMSQYDRPIAVNGRLDVATDGESVAVRIKRIHLEEDAGKLTHESPEGIADASYVDFNRSGIPLIEVVTEPDFRAPAEAYRFLRQLKSILQYTGVSEANMEEGNLRCDANISVRPAGDTALGTKVEIKNLNSFKNVQRALEYEMQRQSEQLKIGKPIEQETRLFDPERGVTQAMRTKEEAHDYRYFPEPDLLPVSLNAEVIEAIRRSMPELPEIRRRRFLDDYGLGAGEVNALVEDKSLADFFEATAAASGDPKQAANWILRDLLEKLSENNQSIEQSSVSPEHIAGLIRLIRNGTISATQARDVFTLMWESGSMPQAIVRERGMAQISDENELRSLVESVLTQNPDIVGRLRNGETKLQGVLVGMVLKQSDGKANPKLVNELIRRLL